MEKLNSTKDFKANLDAIVPGIEVFIKDEEILSFLNNYLRQAQIAWVNLEAIKNENQIIRAYINRANSIRSSIISFLKKHKNDLNFNIADLNDSLYKFYNDNIDYMLTESLNILIAKRFLKLKGEKYKFTSKGRRYLLFKGEKLYYD